MAKVNQLDFTGSTIFCGLDVHKEFRQARTEAE